MTDPCRHPLDRFLGNGWRWLADPVRDTVVLLHRSGLWVEVDRSFLWSEARASFWGTVAGALNRGIASGVVGYRTVETTKVRDGRFEARLIDD